MASNQSTTLKVITLKIITKDNTLEVYNWNTQKSIKLFKIDNMSDLEKAFQVLISKGIGLSESEMNLLRNHFRPIVTPQIKQ